MSYVGSKAKAGFCQLLLGLQPPHNVYVETHLGGGVRMRRKSSGGSIGIDKDLRALAAFTCDHPVALLAGCAHEFLPTFRFHRTEFVYSDPPYRRPPRRSGKRLYRYDFSEADHIARLELLKALPCSVMVSGQPSARYDRMLAGWTRIAWQVTTHARVRTAVTGFNFTLDRVHLAAVAGQNSIDRQRIKPNADRLAMAGAIMPVAAEEWQP